MTREAPEVNDICQEYRAAVLRQGLPHARTDCCVRWELRFARSVPGVALHARTATHVRASLSDLRRQANLEPWQVNQAQEALRMLFQDGVPLPCARPRPF